MAPQVTLNLPESVVARETSFNISSLKGQTSTPMVIPVQLFVSPTMLPSTLSASAVCVYSTESGEPRTVTAEINLPLSFVCKLTSPQPRHKQSAYKLTLDTNKKPLQLVPLFEDMFSQFANEEEANAVTGATANSVLCLQYWCRDIATGLPVDCSILVSKNTGRYRIQSTSLSALCLVADGLTRRLKAWFKKEAEDGGGDGEALVVTCSDEIPFQDYFTVIDQVRVLMTCHYV